MQARSKPTSKSSRLRRRSRSTSTTSRGSPPEPANPGRETGQAYAIFRACGVPVEDGEDFKKCFERVLEQAPLALLSLCASRTDVEHVRYAMQCDRRDALLELYVRMRCREKHDRLLEWDPQKGGLVWFVRRRLHFAACKLCMKVARAHWGVTVSLDEEFTPPCSPYTHYDTVRMLDTLAAKPEPNVCVCARY